ncbi:MAG: DUF4198 domain-containing protein [Spirochaetaceae bacterium]|jgi:cobalt/nickel transport protein|nr:DUF4198 domain-containing protein [Spirochaetaceae bacterium]
MKRSLFLAVAVCALLGGTVHAHQWFATLGDAKEYKPGDAVPLIVYSTHHFMVGEGVQDAARNQFFVLQNNRLTDTAVTVSRNEAQKVLTGSFTLPNGAPALVVVNSVGRFSNATPLGSKNAAKLTVKALGVNVTKTTYSEGWSKIYVNPSSQDRSFTIPLGLPLEIVPVTNPADIAAGSAAVFTVLLRGSPLANAEINATYKGYNSADEEAWAIKGLKTDASGQVSLPIPAGRAARDLWIVKAAYAGEVFGSPFYEAESYNSWVSFVVRK